MIVNKLGKYKFIKDYISRNSIAVSNIKVGDILTVKQIDTQGNKIIGDIMLDWVPWELPVIEYDV